MRYAIATVTALLLVIAGVALGGSGHGWVTGAFGCFFLAPISFIAVANGLSSAPSFRVALSTLAVGLVVCLGVAIATATQDSGYLATYIRTTAPAGIAVGASAYIGWLVITTLATFRARQELRHGT